MRPRLDSDGRNGPKPPCIGVLGHLRWQTVLTPTRSQGRRGNGRQWRERVASKQTPIDAGARRMAQGRLLCAVQTEHGSRKGHAAVLIQLNATRSRAMSCQAGHVHGGAPLHAMGRQVQLNGGSRAATRRRCVCYLHECYVHGLLLELE